MNIYRFVAYEHQSGLGEPFEVMVESETFEVGLKKYLVKYPYEKYDLVSAKYIMSPKECIR